MYNNYFKKRRNVVAIMTLFGTMTAYILRINLSIAIVSMTSKQTSNESILQGQHSEWSSKQKGNVLGAFFYGYILTQIAGGYLGDRYGGSTIFGLSIGITALLTFLTPLFANWNVYALVLLRVLEGICQGPAFPSVKNIWSKWSPPSERSKLLSITFSGMNIGSVVGFVGCGIIAHYFEWQYSFYVTGAIGLIWYLLWFLYIPNDPRDDPYISKEELELLNQNLLEKHVQIPCPWKKIMLSMPVWAITVSLCCECWSGYTMLTQLPMYLKDRFKYDVEKTGLLLMLPYILRTIVMLSSGVIADKLCKKTFTTTQVRKWFNNVSLMNDAFFTTIVCFTNSPVVVIICLTLAIGIGGSWSAGLGSNPLDLAPEHAGVITGIGNTFGTLAGIICPNVAGYIVTNGTDSEWRTVFLLTVGINIAGAVFYGIFASGESQSWSVNGKLESTATKKVNPDSCKNDDCVNEIKN